MKAEEFQERRIEVSGWPVNVSSYRLGDAWHSMADNVSPGASLARATAATREDAERQVVARVGELLGRTRRRPV